jgi:hypothetical protein
MPKTKISEYSATANSNTDVASINIDEGCAPSGINNAIRAVMGHLKDFQQGTNGDPFNGPMNGTLGATTPSTASVTTLTTSSTVTHNGGTANGVAYLNGSKVLTTGSALVFDGSNLGLGVTPSAWGSNFKATQIGNYGAFLAGQTGQSQVFVGANAYTDGTNWRYINASQATRYYQNSGTHVWDTAGSGTAGNAITFTQAMTLDASGNLGVGQTSPTAKLDIVSTNATTAVFRDTSRYALVSIQAGGTNQSSYLDMAPTGTGAAIFQVSSTERMRIDSSGNLLVGTTSNNASSGRVQIKFDGSTLNGLNLQTTYASTGSYYLIFNNSAGSTTGYISQNGTTTVNYNTSSDYRLKNNIAPMTGALAKVALLKPCTYKWNSDGSDGQGFIAHELQEVVPECVTGEKDAMDEEGNPKYQGIDTSFLVATLTAAIQEQQALITSLTERISALEAK